MSEKIVVPVLGESITEATVAKWLKNAGDAVEADEPIVELETDKVNLEVPSPVFLSHFATVASVILSPRTGTTIFSLIYIYSNTLLIISCC